MNKVKARRFTVSSRTKTVGKILKATSIIVFAAIWLYTLYHVVFVYQSNFQCKTRNNKDMKNRFKDHFKINGGTFKTHEDEVEAYAKKIVKDFYTFTNYSNIRMGFNEEQKDILAEHAYQRYIKHRDEQKTRNKE